MDKFKVPVPTIIKFEDDVYADDASLDPKKVLKEWDVMVRRRFAAECFIDSEQTLEKLLKEYYCALSEKVTSFDDRELLQKTVIHHLKIIQACCNKILESPIATRLYLDLMEDVLAAYCNLELHLLRVLKKKQQNSNKREFKKQIILTCSKRIINILTVYLLGDQCHIAHVLMKLDINISQFSKDACNQIYQHFLVKKAVSDHSDMTYCRYHILFSKWKEISQEGKKYFLDTLLYNSFQRSKDAIETNNVLKSILMPSERTSVDLILDIVDTSHSVCTAYFDHYKSMKQSVIKMEAVEMVTSGTEQLANESEPDCVEVFTDVMKTCSISKKNRKRKTDKSKKKAENQQNDVMVIDDDDDDDITIVSVILPEPVCVIDDDKYDDDIELVYSIESSQDKKCKKKQSSSTFLDSIDTSSEKHCRPPQNSVQNNQVSSQNMYSLLDTIDSAVCTSSTGSFLDSIDASSSANCEPLASSNSFLDSIEIESLTVNSNKPVVEDMTSFLTSLTLPARETQCTISSGSVNVLQTHVLDRTGVFVEQQTKVTHLSSSNKNKNSDNSTGLVRASEINVNHACVGTSVNDNNTEHVSDSISAVVEKTVSKSTVSTFNPEKNKTARVQTCEIEIQTDPEPPEYTISNACPVSTGSSNKMSIAIQTMDIQTTSMPDMRCPYSFTAFTPPSDDQSAEISCLYDNLAESTVLSHDFAQNCNTFLSFPNGIEQDHIERDDPYRNANAVKSTKETDVNSVADANSILHHIQDRIVQNDVGDLISAPSATVACLANEDTDSQIMISDVCSIGSNIESALLLDNCSRDSSNLNHFNSEELSVNLQCVESEQVDRISCSILEVKTTPDKNTSSDIENSENIISTLDYNHVPDNNIGHNIGRESLPTDRSNQEVEQLVQQDPLDESLNSLCSENDVSDLCEPHEISISETVLYDGDKCITVQDTTPDHIRDEETDNNNMCVAERIDKGDVPLSKLIDTGQDQVGVPDKSMKISVAKNLMATNTRENNDSNGTESMASQNGLLVKNFDLCKELRVEVELVDINKYKMKNYNEFNRSHVKEKAAKILYTATDKITPATLDSFTRFENAHWSRSHSRQDFDDIMTLNGPLTKLNGKNLSRDFLDADLDVFDSRHTGSKPLVPNMNKLDNYSNNFTAANDGNSVNNGSKKGVLVGILKKPDPQLRINGQNSSDMNKKKRFAFDPYVIEKDENHPRKRIRRNSISFQAISNSHEWNPRRHPKYTMEAERFKVSKRSLRSYGISLNDEKLNSTPAVQLNVLTPEEIEEWKNKAEFLQRRPILGDKLLKDRVDKDSVLLKIEYDKSTSLLNANDTVKFIEGEKQRKFPLIVSQQEDGRKSSRHVSGIVEYINNFDSSSCDSFHSSPNEQFIEACNVLSEEFNQLSCNNPTTLDLGIPLEIQDKLIDPESEFSNSPKFLQDSDQLVQHCLQETSESNSNDSFIRVNQGASFLSNNSNFYESQVGLPEDNLGIASILPDQPVGVETSDMIITHDYQSHHSSLVSPNMIIFSDATNSENDNPPVDINSKSCEVQVASSNPEKHSIDSSSKVTSGDSLDSHEKLPPPPKRTCRDYEKNSPQDYQVTEVSDVPENDEKPSPEKLMKNLKDSVQLPAIVPVSYDFEKNINKNDIFNQIELTNLDTDSDNEIHLPLKKRKLPVKTLKSDTIEEEKKEEISYPATPMISIAEVEALSRKYSPNPNPRPFKTPAERKEMPPLPSYYNINNVNPSTIEPSPIITDQFNINNHTYNNPTINYHMNHVPLPFINLPNCGQYYTLPSFILPFSNVQHSFDPNNKTSSQQEQPTATKKEEKKTTRNRRH